MTRPDVDDPFRSAAVAYLAGVLPWSTLVEHAVQLVTRTASAPESTVELASSGAEPGMADATALIGTTLADLDLPAVDAGELSKMRSATGLRDIAAGRVAPVEGAHRLWTGRETDGDPYDVLQLVGRWENHLGERSAIEERIRALAGAAVPAEER